MRSPFLWQEQQIHVKDAFGADSDDLTVCEFVGLAARSLRQDERWRKVWSSPPHQ